MQMRAIDLRDVTTVVIDEADQMADMGFLPAVRRIVEQTAPTARCCCSRPPSTARSPRSSRLPARPGAPRGRAEGPGRPRRQPHFWVMDRDRARRHDGVGDRAPRLDDRVHPNPHGADRLAKQLGKLGVSAEPIHGGRSQGQRDRALAAFKQTGRGADRHRRRGARHPRRRRRGGGPLRPAGRRRHLPAPVGPHGARRRTRHRRVAARVRGRRRRRARCSGRSGSTSPCGRVRPRRARPRGARRLARRPSPSRSRSAANADPPSPRTAPAAGEAPVEVGAANGSVKFFNSGRGYGFIVPDDGGRTCSCTSRTSPPRASRRSTTRPRRVRRAPRPQRPEAFDVRVVDRLTGVGRGPACAVRSLGPCTTTVSWSRTESAASCGSACSRSSTASTARWRSRPARPRAARTVRPRSAWGAPWATTWFRFAARSRASGRARRVEAVIDLGFTRAPPGSSARARRRARPTGDAPCRASTRRTNSPSLPTRAGRRARRSRVEPVVPQFRPSPLGSPTPPATEPLYRFRAPTRRSSTAGRGARPRLDVLDG